MAANEKGQNHWFRKWVLQNFFSLAAIIVAIANLWLLGKLAPLSERISILETRINAMERRQDNIEAALGRIENKIDDVVFRLLK